MAAAAALLAAGAAAFAGVAQSQSAGPPVSTGVPIVLGSFQQGSTLSVLSGDWDGNPFSFSYQWQRCDPAGGFASCANIRGASHPTYRLVAADVANLVRVRVVATNAEGPSAAAFSAKVGPVVDAGAPSNSASPSIQGAAPPIRGRALSGSPGRWIDATRFEWQWLRCDASGRNCAAIQGATSPNYTPVVADVDSKLRLLVRATNVGTPAGRAQVVSRATGKVVGARPSNVVRPTITGTPTVGEILTASSGTWDGQEPITYTYQWRRCNEQGQSCQGVTGATQQTYQLSSADQGSTIVVTVRAHNVDGNAFSSSLPTAVIAGIPAGQTVPVSQVSLPNRLVITTSEFNPSVLRSRAPFSARFRVMDTEGHFVSGVDVFLSVIPFGRVAPPGTRRTDQNGWVTFRMQPTAKFPLVKGYLITIFARATKPGDDLLAGVSSRRLVSVKINPR